MVTTTNHVRFKGQPLTLVGNEVTVGQTAPDFVAVANDLSPVKLSQYRGSVCILVAVPSLDTPVCSLETRRFNDEVRDMGEGVKALAISMDLPFAQKRWCDEHDIREVVAVSDHRGAEFGMNYGVLIQELRLLARAVFVVDRDGVLRYRQLVEETTNEPDYDEVLDAAKKLI